MHRKIKGTPDNFFLFFLERAGELRRRCILVERKNSRQFIHSSKTPLETEYTCMIIIASRDNWNEKERQNNGLYIGDWKKNKSNTTKCRYRMTGLVRSVSKSGGETFFFIITKYPWPPCTSSENYMHESPRCTFWYLQWIIQQKHWTVQTNNNHIEESQGFP